MAEHGYPGVIDADGHVMETDAEIFEYLPPPYRGQTQLFTAPNTMVAIGCTSPRRTRQASVYD